MALPVLEGEAVGPKCRASRVGLPRMESMPQCANRDSDQGLAKQAGWWVRVLPSRVMPASAQVLQGWTPPSQARTSLHADTPIQAES